MCALVHTHTHSQVKQTDEGEMIIRDPRNHYLGPFKLESLFQTKKGSFLVILQRDDYRRKGSIAFYISSDFLSENDALIIVRN